MNILKIKRSRRMGRRLITCSETWLPRLIWTKLTWKSISYIKNQRLLSLT